MRTNWSTSVPDGEESDARRRSAATSCYDSRLFCLRARDAQGVAGFTLDLFVLTVFLIVYFGMFLGELPGLALDRTGVALLGAIAILACGRLETRELARAVDIPTLALLLGLMIVSAQFRLSGFYAWLVRRVDAWDGHPPMLLALMLLVAAVLSAVLANDIVCLAMTPVLIECCVRREPGPEAILGGSGLCGQRRIGGHADRQSSEHADRTSPAAVVHALPSCGGDTVAAGHCGDLVDHLACQPRALASGVHATAHHRPAVSSVADRQGTGRHRVC